MLNGDHTNKMEVNMSGTSVLKIVIAAIFSVGVLPTIAADDAAKKTADTVSKVVYQPVKGAEDPQKSIQGSELIFSAPPREPAEVAKELYEPIAAYLSKAIGKKVTFRYPGSWGVYQGTMQKGGYDLVFDGPHFNGWRMAKLQHNILVKIPNDFTFVTVTKRENDKITNIKQLAGLTVCAHAPPNLGTLTLLSQFDNPARQPVLISTDGWDNIYKGMVAGLCVAAVMPTKTLEKLDKSGAATKIIHKAKSLPNNALSASPRVSPEDQEKIARALVSSEASGPTEKFRQAYNVGKGFVPANKQEFVGLGELLKNEWGYY
jgi:ABC-type phosphate/phosphonate transport system substrate-binding protein